MDVFEAIFKRRGIRKFQKKPIGEDIIRKIVEAGIWAPSAGDLQSWDLIIVKDHETKVEIVNAALGQYFIAESPILIVSCANKQRSAAKYMERGKYLYCIQDAAVAAQNMLLAIHALGLGACWVGAFDERAVAEILNIPESVRPVALIPVGYPDEKPYSPPRRSIEEVIHYEKF